MRNQDVANLQEEIRELALDQIRDLTLEVLQLRAMLEYSREQQTHDQGIIDGFREIIKTQKLEMGCMMNQIKEQQEQVEELTDALSAAKASIVSYQELLGESHE